MNCTTCQEPVLEADRHVATYKGSKVIGQEHHKCEQKRLREEYRQTGRLITRLWMDASLATMHMGLHVHCVDDDIVEAGNRLEESVKRFCVEVWFGGASATVQVHGLMKEKQLMYARLKDSLQSIIEDNPHRTLVAKVAGSNITVTGQEIAGRALVEIEDPEARITLIAAAREQTNRMGIQGLEGTEERLHMLIDCVRRNWRDLRFKKHE